MSIALPSIREFDDPNRSATMYYTKPCELVLLSLAAPSLESFFETLKRDITHAAESFAPAVQHGNNLSRTLPQPFLRSKGVVSTFQDDLLADGKAEMGETIT